MLLQKSESQEHKSLVDELSVYFRAYGLTVDYIDREGYKKPPVVENVGKVGDGNDKIPDIQGESKDGTVYRGEAKCGNGDIDSEHSITQYSLFSRRMKGNLPSQLLIIVPQSEVQHLNMVLNENLEDWQIKRIGVVPSHTS